MTTERDFKGVWIPKDIWLCEELTMLEKVLFVEMNSLDNENGCYASNKYLAEFCNCSESKVTKAVSKLVEYNLVEVVDFDGRRRVIRTHPENINSIVKSTRQHSKKYEAPSEILLPNNINNNTNNNPIPKGIGITPLNSSEQGILFSKPKKTKSSRKQDIDNMFNMVLEFTQNSEIQELLKQYLGWRLGASKGFNSEQWKILLDDLREFAGDDAGLAKDRIRTAIAGEYRSIIPSWEKDKAVNRKPKKAKFDTSTGHCVERRDVVRNLVVDSDGNTVTV